MAKITMGDRTLEARGIKWFCGTARDEGLTARARREHIPARGVAQPGKRAWLITRRPQVQILPPQPDTPQRGLSWM